MIYFKKMYLKVLVSTRISDFEVVFSIQKTSDLFKSSFSEKDKKTNDSKIKT